MKTFAFRLLDEQLEKLKQRAIKERRTISAVIRRIIEKDLEKEVKDSNEQS